MALRGIPLADFRLRFMIVSVGAVVFLEIIARFVMGLGSPPLYIPDALTEYRLKPNQSLYRFGNRININAYSMRSAPLSKRRHSRHRRVLVFGDSVVWGGAVMDQSLIATELLSKGGDFEVGNVAAPSWGPGNWLGWAQRFGFLDSTDVILVINGHDAADNPSSVPFSGNINHPLSPPSLALVELVQRYLLPRFGIFLDRENSSNKDIMVSGPSDSITDPRVSRGLKDLRAFLRLARRSGAHVVVVQFADRQDVLSGSLSPGHRWIKEVLLKEGVPGIDSSRLFRECGPIDRLFVDGIHPYTPAGQACLAKVISQALLS